MPKGKKVKSARLGTKVSKKQKFKYHLEIYINDIIYAVDTDNIWEALVDFKNSPYYPSIIKTRVQFKYDNGKTFREKTYFNTIDSRREFDNKTSLELLGKTLMKELG